ncbi:MAG: hypothetical protein Satyrvirus9_6 [Satyrvirus sp.]|uniref:Minor capsid protein P9 transmembrane helices domain-containing protein n=1 Tax=Satyrvirus sp. TaxID=2487771 RepID=A0A3G5ADM3_9VIRU|nr:MAG: hypothetical protein Satyrvirus9_6 [Satyrvirus sp.]
MNHSENNNDIIWLRKPSILFTCNNYSKIWPNSQMTKNQKINAATRLIIYSFIVIIFIFGLVYALSSRPALYILLAAIAIVVVILWYKFSQSSNQPYNKIEIFNTGNYQNTNQNRTNEESSTEQPEPVEPGKLNKINKINSKKYFPNDQTGFAKWLYLPPKTCKENSMYCLKYEDLRFNRYNPDIDKFNSL